MLPPSLPQDTDALSQAHYLLRAFWLRRTKQEVELSLPPKVELVVKCPLSAAQTQLYRSLLLQEWEAIHAAEERLGAAAGGGSSGAPQDTSAGALETIGGGGGAGAGGGGGGSVPQAVRNVLNNLVMQLRKCCNHPVLIADPDRWPPLADMVEQSGKLAVLDRLLTRLRAGGHRIVLFSQFTSMLDVLQEYLKQRGCAPPRSHLCSVIRRLAAPLIWRPRSRHGTRTIPQFDASQTYRLVLKVLTAAPRSPFRP